MNVTLESVPSATGTPTPKTPRSAARAKQISTHAGFRYEVGNPRKNGTEVWKCIDKDCKASVIKKGDSFSLTKEHSLAGGTMQTSLQHVTMTLMRDRALKFPAETPAQIIHNVTTSVRDLVLATAPPPSTLEKVIADWRQGVQGEKASKKKAPGSATPKNQNRKGESSRKRLKMTPKGKNQVEDSEEEELDELEKLEDEMGGDEDEEEEEEDYVDDDEEEEQIVPKKRPRQSGSDEDSE